jgi:opacity protein-like surface antigen
VWGVEFSGRYGDVSGAGSCIAGIPSPFLNCETKLDWTIQMLARFGYAIGDGRFLPYITGGAVRSRIGINRVFDIGLPEVWGEKRWTPGGAIGAGFQYGLGSGFSIGLEYLYTSYFNQNYSTLISCGCDSVSEQSLNTHSVRVSLNYTFGAPPKVQDGMHTANGAQTGVYDWTGFYVGGHSGWQHATQSGGSQEILYTDKQSFNAGLSGLQFGYNYQIDRFIFGLEASGTLPWKGSSSEFCDSTNLLLCRTRQEWSSLFLARFGYAMGDGRLMPYVVSGLALARLRVDYDALGTPYGTASTTPGAVFGAGLQYALGNGWSAGIEYLFTSYANQDFSSVAHTGFPGDFADDQNRFTTQTLRFAMNYKFGGASQSQNAPRYNWSGFYIGAHGTYDDIWSKGSDDTLLLIGGCCGLTNQEVRGFSGGVQFGYNYQINRAVIGGEISFTPGGISGTSDCASLGLSGFCRLKKENSAMLLTRLGYALDDGSYMPYIVAGVALTQFDTERGFGSWGGTKLATGAVGGFGLQYAITNNLSLGVEYLFTQYGAVRFMSDFVSPALAPVSQNISSDTARLVLNYNLGG